jgi:hypothetical protein
MAEHSAAAAVPFGSIIACDTYVIQNSHNVSLQITKKGVPKCRKDTYASSVFMVNGFESANESNAAGFPAAPSVARPTLLMLLLMLSAGLIFSCRAGDLIAAPARRSGIVTVCTGVTPPNVVLLPPQNALVARRGDVEGRSLWILGVSSDEVDAELRAGVGAVIGMGLGGGRTGELERPAPPRRAFLSALISCCIAEFSDFVEPSSTRIASMRRSRSATSPSRVVIYSVRKYKEVESLKIIERRWDAHPCDGYGSCGR